jgi:predicted acetyltransferase
MLASTASISASLRTWRTSSRGRRRPDHKRELVSGTPMKLVHRNTSGPLPTSSFDLINAAGEAIGYAQLRHRPSCNADLPPEAGNSIYYEIASEHRGQGHGKALLGLVLDEARRIGLQAVRLTVTDNNPTSRHIIEGAGGQLVGEFTARTGELYRLFEISLLRIA